jgi:hypothetical protein
VGETSLSVHFFYSIELFVSFRGSNMSNLISLGNVAFRRYNPVIRPVKGSISIEELNKITMHLHSAQRISKDVSKLVVDTSIEQFQKESNIVFWDKNIPRRPPRTFVFANMEFTYEKLHYLFSPTSLQFPSSENRFVFIGCTFDKSQASIRGLLSLLTIRMMHPESICLLRSRTLDHIKSVKSAHLDASSVNLNSLEKSLPISLVIDQSAFITNGGVSNLTCDMMIDDLQRLSRKDPDNEAIFKELIYAVPSIKTKKSTKDDILFNTVQLETFLSANNLKYLIRNHENPKDAYKLSMKAKCISFNGSKAASKVGLSRPSDIVSTHFGHNMSCLSLIRDADTNVLNHKLVNL